MLKKTLLLFIIFLTAAAAQEKARVIIDADTGNEVDDLYAVVRGLIEPSWDVLGLNATQWQTAHWAVPKSMEESYRLNQVLLSYLKMNETVASNRGGKERLFDWGNKAQTSTSSNFIIREALKPADDKLNVIALGALTNVASAILDNPEITDRIRVYWLGISYNFETEVMKAVTFNGVMDIQAVDVVFNSDVELHVIPTEVAASMTFDWDETRGQFEGKHDLLDYLVQRWYNHMDGGRRERVIWDLALIQAIIFPDMAEEVTVTTPPAYGGREVYLYKSIDADRMREEFFNTTLEHVKTLD